MKKRLDITLSEDLIGEIERRRGLATKSTIIEHELRKSFGMLPYKASRREMREG
jgi:hypothetical protein